jgi:hypothetical protein
MPWGVGSGQDSSATFRDDLAAFERLQNIAAVSNGKLQPVTAGASTVEIYNRIDTEFLCGNRNFFFSQARHAGTAERAGADVFGKAHPFFIRVRWRRSDCTGPPGESMGALDGAAIRLG